MIWAKKVVYYLNYGKYDHEYKHKCRHENKQIYYVNRYVIINIVPENEISDIKKYKYESEHECKYQNLIQTQIWM